MQVTAIKPQLKSQRRYSIFLDGKYAFSLSDLALIDSKLKLGIELSQEQVAKLKQKSDDDKIYFAVLNYLAIRSRSSWEIKTYLQKKKASPALSDYILNKLSDLNLINDKSYAESFVRDRRLLRPSSARKLKNDLRQKHISVQIIEEVIGNDNEIEMTALHSLIKNKRRQSRYQDDLKLMQYLSRQGFNYSDIKQALGTED
ncbi:MAG: hypothetical protein NVS1B10_01870 [Candidatus Saccharimonadales bacterium]